MDENQKKIDEQWKEQVLKERSELKDKPGSEQDFLPPEPDFTFFITTLALQASISLGAMPNPATNQKELNLSQAKFLIDTMGMLQEKTSGNLTAEESKLIESVLYELRTNYIQQSQIQGNAEKSS
jgi:hypothetical protein